MIAVYYFGGGTFAISILELGKGVIEVRPHPTVTQRTWAATIWISATSTG